MIVKLSSLGDVVHALPVVADIRVARPGVRIDWVVEPGFAPLLQRTEGVDAVIEMPLRRWRREGLLRAAVRSQVRAFVHRLRRERYDLVLDLQGLTKSALVAALARGPSVGLANRTEGSSHEAPARWLVGRAIRVEPRSHAVDRSRELAAKALGTAVSGPPRFGLRGARRIGSGSATGERAEPPPAGGSDGLARVAGAALRGAGGADVAAVGDADESAAAAIDGAGTRPDAPVVFIHGTSRADKLWPEANWIELGRRLANSGARIALPTADAAERARAEHIAAGIGAAAQVWPTLDLGSFVDRLAASAGAIGVDSGPSHIAVALGLPHVQVYNHPTAWRTGPQARHGARHQVAVEGRPAPSVYAVWEAWQRVGQPAPGASPSA
nr:lipopolysaccharide heptosyltransferase I [Schlegelella koreensis]